MTHDEAITLLPDYALGALDDARALEAHLRDCPVCTAELASYLETAAPPTATGSIGPGRTPRYSSSKRCRPRRAARPTGVGSSARMAPGSPRAALRSTRPATAGSSSWAATARTSPPSR